MIHFERWSLLIIGAALRHKITRLDEFEKQLDVARTTLATWLDALVASGLMHSSGGPAVEVEYTLTEKGADLASVITAIDQWSERWALPVPAPAELTMTDPDDATPPLEIDISLMGAFELKVGGRSVRDLSVGSQRLLVFLALHDRAMARVSVAGSMWPEVSDERAGISLRSALSRLDPETREAIMVASVGLGLADTVTVDYRVRQTMARRILRGEFSPELLSQATALLSEELLPDWYDDWVVAEAEDWRQLRVSALETLADVLVDQDRLAEAAGAARAAIKVDPLRESAHATLIRVHLAEGNQSEALRVFDRYSALLLSALNLGPTPHLVDLVESIRSEVDGNSAGSS